MVLLNGFGMNKRNGMMVLFFLLVMAIYFVVNYYIYKRSSVLFAEYILTTRILQGLLIFIMISFPAGKIIEQFYPGTLSTLLIKIGSLWLGAMLYLTLLFLLIDLVRFGFKISGNPMGFPLRINPIFTKWVTLSVYSLSTVVIIGGFFNALYPGVTNVPIQSQKVTEPIRIVAVSDIHLGSIIGKERLKRLVRMVNRQQPDLILLAGDIFDDNVKWGVFKDWGQYFLDFSAPMGVYAIMGNHEYIGNADSAEKLLEQHGIRVLRDSSTELEKNLTLIGRDDRMAVQMRRMPRMELSQLVENIDASTFTILLDHQPYQLNEAVEHGIDLQISGHTHHGQLFPLNLITRSIFELSKGYKQIGESHFYVSTGYGTWGPPIRVGNRPEVVVFSINH